MTRTHAALACALLALAAVLVPAAPASAGWGIFATKSTATTAVPGDTVEFWADDAPTGITAYGWEFRPAGSGTWSPIGGSMDFIIHSVTAYSGGDYRVWVDRAEGRMYAEPVTLSVPRIDWDPAAVYVPEGTPIAQSATAHGLDAATIRWETATSSGGPYTAIPGATGATLATTAALSMHGAYLRPAATVGGREVGGEPHRIFVYAAAPAPVPQQDAEALADDTTWTFITGAQLDGDELVVSVPGGDAHGPETWYHGTAYSTPTSLGWARFANGQLRFDVSGLVAGEHVLLLRLPTPSGGLGLSDAVRFTIPAAAAPGAAADPELAATGAEAAVPLAASGLLAVLGVLLLVRARRREA